MHARHLNFCLAILAVFYFSLMNGRYKCGAPSCRRTFDSSGALLRHRPSCLSYQQQAAIQANFRCKRLQSNTGRDSVALKKLKLLQGNDVRESIAAILTLSHLKDHRIMTRQNLIHPAPSRLCSYRRHTPLPHLNVLTVLLCWMLLAPVRLRLRSTGHYCTMFMKLSCPLCHYLTLVIAGKRDSGIQFFQQPSSSATVSTIAQLWCI